jgi:hypothetical protein
VACCPKARFFVNEDTKTLFDRFREMPRAIQWGTYFALGLVIFLVWSERIAPLARDFKTSADRISADLRVVRDTAAMQQQIDSMQDTIHGVGQVLRPRPAADGEIALNRAVNEVLQDFNISNDSFSARVRGSLQRGSLPGLTGNSPAQLLSGELKFNATPDDAIAIIAALEMRPEIEAINTIFLTRIAGRRVSVQITMEAWVLPLDGGGRRGGTI